MKIEINDMNVVRFSVDVVDIDGNHHEFEMENAQIKRENREHGSYHLVSFDGYENAAGQPVWESV